MSHHVALKLIALVVIFGVAVVLAFAFAGETAALPGAATTTTRASFPMSNLRPLGIPLQLAEQIKPGDPFTMTFTATGCTFEWISDGQPALSEGRCWLNLNYVWRQEEEEEYWPRAVDDSVGTATLSEWMSHGWNGTLYNDCEWNNGCTSGDYVHTDVGTNLPANCSAPENTPIRIVVYDTALECADIPEPKPPCPSQGGGYHVHVVGFAGIEITECNYTPATIEAQFIARYPYQVFLPLVFRNSDQ